MGGPGVECTSAGWSAPSPPTPHLIRPRDPGAHKCQGLLLCAEQAEAGVMATAFKSRGAKQAAQSRAALKPCCSLQISRRARPVPGPPPRLR
jgi:hypothetical protein